MKKREKLILTAGPSITDKEISYVNDAITNGWNENWNKYIVKFEESFAKYIGVKYAMTTSSCTGAMHLALKALGVKEGDEVLVPEITWVATASVVTYVGAKPVFVDVENDTWCMDPKSVKSSITSRTKAIMPVHLYGHPADMDEITEIANHHNLYVLEDAAPSLGAEYKGKKTGSLGNASAFSFQGAKIATTGEGGIFLTDDSDLFKRVVKLGDHGRSLTKALWNDEVGHKYKMSNIQAALGLAQLERIEELVAKKRQIFSWYANHLKEIDGVSLNVERQGYHNIYWMTTMILDKDFGITRDDLITKLKKWNIDSRPVFYPLSHFPMFEKRQNKNAERLSSRGINLPSGHNLMKDDVEYICEVIKIILEEKQ